MKARAGSARLFVAIDLPALVRGRLASWARAATAQSRRGGGVSPPRLLAPELLHVTLCFLGAQPVERIEAIGDAVKGCVGSVGEISLGAPVWLPPRHPRALAVEVHDDHGALLALHDEVLRALADVCEIEPQAGAPGRQRRFRPHVTVARMREGAAPRDRELAEPTPSLDFVPESITLYRSWLSPDGASYEALASRELHAG